MLEPGRFALLFALLLGCTSPPPPEQEPTGVDEPEPEQAQPTVLTTAPPAPRAFDRPGPAYLLVGRQVVELDDHDWTSVDLPELADRDSVFALFVGGDGYAYARSWKLVGRLEHGHLEPLLRVDDPHRIVAATVGSSAELALVTESRFEQRATHVLRHGRWSSAPTQLNPWPFSHSAAFDRNTDLWLWFSEVERSEWHWPSASERRVPVELPGPRARATISASPTGDVYMFVDEAFYRLTDPEPARVPLPGVSVPSRAKISTNGNIALSWPDCRIARVTVGEPPRVEFIDADVDCHFEEDYLAIDGRNRIWVGARTSTWVFPPGQPPVEYKMGTVPLLARGVTEIAVVGAGPELPPPGPVRTTTLRGTIVAADVKSGPADNRALVLSSARNHSERAREYEFHTSTNERGEFEFADIPIGPYELASEDRKLHWMLDWGAGLMREGEVLDLGQLRAAVRDFDIVAGSWE